jgi:hypothetical protein
MQAAQNPAGGEGLVVLSEVGGKAGSGEDLLVKELGKPSASGEAEES